ncbi:uncharacterized protein LOC62_02G002062 [Vanrija pseudolonga]|nr:hypothetical protein LOC62_02G002062 [Vanrija pseudolonga]
MPSSSAPSSSQYTVLRIKRKATEAAPASLAVIGGGDEADQSQTRRKRRDIGGGRSRGVFRLADTVPQTWQGHGEEGEVLKSRIEGLLAGSTKPEAQASTAGSVAPPASVPIPTAPAAAPTQPPSAATQYRVVPRPAAPFAQDPGLPPRVITLAEIEAARSALVLVDAQAVADAGLSRSALDDPQMAAFLPMLNEYLKLESTPRPIVEDEEYVYDLYYRDLAANGDDIEPSANVATLLGYEDLSPPSTPPDSEPEDEADEDSNDEDYYRNDYPEDEDADEDMEDFEDAYSDGEWSNNDDDEEDERGTWDYR